MKTELTRQVLRYQRLHTSDEPAERRAGRRLYRRIEERCQIIIYTYPVRIRAIDEELAGELLLSMTSRIPKMVLTFTYTSVSFENFLRRVSYLQSRMLVGRKRHAQKRELCLNYPQEAIEQLITSDQAVHYEQKTSYEIILTNESWSINTEPGKKIREELTRSKTFRKRFLQLVIRCADCLNSQQIAFLAHFLEVDEFELAELMQRARELAFLRRCRLQKMKQIRDRHYFNSIIYQREYEFQKQLTQNPRLISASRIRYEKELKRFNDRNRELHQKSNPITHEILASITQVPKGTVDSGLSSLKRYLREIVDG